MFFVLVLHANYLSIGAPELGQVSLAEYSIRHFIEVYTYIAVDVFILISGYFSIRPSLKSISNLLFCCFFYSVGIRIVYSSYYLMIGEVAPKPFWESLLFLSNSVWFVVDYLMLVVFAPILNAFIDNSSKRISLLIVILMVIFSTYFGLLRRSLMEYVSGFSFVTFIMIYLIGRILYLYQGRIESHIKPLAAWGGHFLGTFLLFAVVLLAAHKGHHCYLEHLGRCEIFSYSNPLVILSAVSVFWLFVQKEFYSGKINKLAKSTLAILLLHSNPVSVIIYNHYFSYVYGHFNFGLYLFIMLVSCVAVFFSSVLIDQIRIWGYDNYIKARVLSLECKVVKKFNEGI